MIPLTPALKHSDPFNHSKLFEEKHVFKRSNSQSEMDLFNMISSGNGGFHGTFLDFFESGDNQNNLDNLFSSNGFEQL